MGYCNSRIIADCAEPRSIEELRRKGLTHINKSYKGHEIMYGIDICRNFKVYIDKIRTPNFIMEISNYCLKKDKFDKLTNIPEDKNNHLMDAWRYAMIDVNRGRIFL